MIITLTIKLKTQIHNSQLKNKEHELKLKTRKSKINIQQTVSPNNKRTRSLNLKPTDP